MRLVIKWNIRCTIRERLESFINQMKKKLGRQDRMYWRHLNVIEKQILWYGFIGKTSLPFFRGGNKNSWELKEGLCQIYEKICFLKIYSLTNLHSHLKRRIRSPRNHYVSCQLIFKMCFAYYRSHISYMDTSLWIVLLIESRCSNFPKIV